MINKKIYHAAIYVRLSKEDGDVANAAKTESNSISNQKNLIKDFLKDKEDIVVVSERVDDGYSGSNFERPGFEEMTRQNRYIFIPFPQGRNMYGKDIQTMKEILAETSLSDGLTEIPV